QRSQGRGRDRGVRHGARAHTSVGHTVGDGLKAVLYTSRTTHMSQGSRPDRVADQIRSEVASMLAREVHDPGIGFVTITRVTVTPDIQLARVYYTALGDERARQTTGRALGRAPPLLRRQIGSRLR